MRILEYKDFVGSVKDVDTAGRRITGYLSAFGNKDHDDDIVVKGAFAKTLKERGPLGSNQIFFLNQHNWAQPHGKFAVLQEDEKGLYFESDKLPNTTYSNDTLELYAQGIIKEHSHGFVTIKSNKSDEGARMLTELKLYEGSNVTLGANSNTPFTGFKSLTFEQLNEKSNAIIKMLRNGTLTDDTFIQLEIALKQIQKEAYELGKKALEPKPSDKDTSITKEPLISAIKKFNNSLIQK